MVKNPATVGDARVALITGAARGIGDACAKRLAKDGYHVVIVDKDDGDDVVRAIERDGGRAAYEHCDLSNVDECRDVAARVIERFGRCDALVNNAAHLGRASIEEIDFTQWRQEFAVNVDASFVLSLALVDSMREHGFGRIVNMISNTVWQPPPMGLLAYVSTKTALLGFTRALAIEVGQWGITVNALAPGLTRTSSAVEHMPASHFDAVLEQQAIKRSVMPEDVAGALSFLVSEDASAITGQSLRVDGGLVTL